MVHLVFVVKKGNQHDLYKWFGYSSSLWFWRPFCVPWRWLDFDLRIISVHLGLSVLTILAKKFGFLNNSKITAIWFSLFFNQHMGNQIHPDSPFVKDISQNWLDWTIRFANIMRNLPDHKRKIRLNQITLSIDSLFMDIDGLDISSFSRNLFPLQNHLNYLSIVNFFTAFLPSTIFSMLWVCCTFTKFKTKFPVQSFLK